MTVVFSFAKLIVSTRCKTPTPISGSAFLRRLPLQMWPRVSVWHGNADKTVIPSNADEILKQWTEVHGLPITPSGQAMVDGYPRRVWVSETGDELIESYTITHMAHGAPLATGEADDACGAAGPFLLEVGISSSYQ